MSNSDLVGEFGFGTGKISARRDGTFMLSFFNGNVWTFDVGEISALDEILSRIEDKKIEPKIESPVTFWATTGNKVLEVYLGQDSFSHHDLIERVGLEIGFLKETFQEAVFLRLGGSSVGSLPVREISWLRRNIKVLTEGAPYHRAVRLLDVVEESHVDRLLRVERFPLNNRHSTSPMRFEREFSQETTKAVSVELSFGTGIDYYIRMGLEARFGLTKERKLSERILVYLEAEPGEHKEYLIAWKEVTTNGYAVFEVNSEKQRVPFSLTSGLIPDIRQEVIARDGE